MSIEAPFYPIIYIRGYAATMGEIEDTVATPYMGFNLGSTKLRQSYDGEIVNFIFESPLIRLMKDEGYSDVYQDGEVIPRSEKTSPRSIWIFRYYEPVSEDLGEGERRSIPRFAADLRRFILRVRDQTCGNDETMRAGFKVYLVAHSMGGLIARCYLQNICRYGLEDAYGSANAPGLAEETAASELSNLPAETMVDKVFTYGTPHNGIEMAGRNVPDLASLDRLHARNFNRSFMRDYLKLPGSSTRVDSLGNAFPTERFFCFIGSNYRDYDAFLGLSKKGTGPLSDGLVMMSNAGVEGAPRAAAHRSHSGPYGIVNSEEGYQNLRRFLFGDIRVDVTLHVDELTLPTEITRELGGNMDRLRAAYNIEASGTLRGLNVFLNERRVAQESAIRKTYEELLNPRKQVYLFSTYLLRRAKTGARDTALAFALEIGVQVPVYEIDNTFWLDDHYEGGYVYRDTVAVHVRQSKDSTTVKYGLASVSGAGSANSAPSELPASVDGQLVYEIPIGFNANTSRKPKPGMRGRLRFAVSPWNQ